MVEGNYGFWRKKVERRKNRGMCKFVLSSVVVKKNIA